MQCKPSNDPHKLSLFDIITDVALIFVVIQNATVEMCGIANYQSSWEAGIEAVFTLDEIKEERRTSKSQQDSSSISS